MKRFDLIPPSATAQVAEVFNMGLVEGHHKNGWRKEKVSTLLNKLKEKLNNFENLEDIDEDKIHNMAKVAAYATMILDSLKFSPQNDDRNDSYFEIPRIALDVDDVVADFTKAYVERTGDTMSPYWACSYNMPENLKSLMDDEDFWVNIPVKHKPNFEPTCYISSRSLPVEFTQKFIQKAGLPCAPVYHVPWNTSKLEVLKRENIELFIDDKVSTFMEVSKAGIPCLLMDTEHNRYFDAKGKRIYNLELFK